MKTIFKLTIIIGILAWTPANIEGARQQTVHYRLSVTLPEMVGLNTKPKNNISLSLNSSNTNQYDISVEQAIRNKKKVLLNTITIK